MNDLSVVNKFKDENIVVEKLENLISLIVDRN